MSKSMSDYNHDVTQFVNDWSDMMIRDAERAGMCPECLAHAVAVIGCMNFIYQKNIDKDYFTVDEIGVAVTQVVETLMEQMRARAEKIPGSFAQLN